MNKRIYEHQCKDNNCGIVFYVESLLLLAIARCPKCSGESMYMNEYQRGVRH